MSRSIIIAAGLAMICSSALGEEPRDSNKNQAPQMLLGQDTGAECDHLAAYPLSRWLPPNVKGVYINNIDAARAITACSMAKQSLPEEPRFPFQLGRSLERAGRFAEAAIEYQSPADRGYAPAMNNLGLLLMTGKGVAKDQMAGVEWFRKAAAKGDSSGLTHLGSAYAVGAGVNADVAEAVKLYRLAAAEGEADAMFYLGDAYLNGRLGLSESTKTAMEWFLKAADAGSAMGMARLGVSYFNGDGVAADEAIGAKWSRMAAEAGNVDGMRNVAVAYAEGRGVELDGGEAARWYQKAADLGDLDAMVSLGTLDNDGEKAPEKQEAAFQLFLKAAEAGNGRGMMSLGAAYWNGAGVPRNPTEAIKWLQKAGAAGNTDALRSLGVIYANGLDVDKDEAKARQFFGMAADAGDKVSALKLKIFKHTTSLPLPSTEKFMGIISLCGTSNKITISGNLEGSIRAFYESARSSGYLTLEQSSGFLALFPEKERAAVYKMYTGCVMNVVATEDAKVTESEVKMLRLSRKMGDLEYDYFLSLSPEAFARLDWRSERHLVNKDFFASFLISCNSGKVLGPFTFKYTTGIIDYANIIAIPIAYNLEGEGVAQNLQENPDLNNDILFIAENNVVFAVNAKENAMQMYDELQEDFKEVFKNSECSQVDLKIDQYLMLSLVGTDGFDVDNYFVVSARVESVIDNVPQIQIKLSRIEKDQYMKKSKEKPSFDYDRLSIFSDPNGGSRVIIGMRSVDSGIIMSQYRPFIQPTVKFLTSIKTKIKLKN
ncbi:hypothetical protein ELH24_21715 [Rhizobium ruizarguesonis]|uniref:SEL1-like repeat protein n=1 Tax=Rhizobium ruizarguesonis TaxID=2081791 RepID=UPI0010302EEB|nr:SEL1-like repeat protein [Rhizobium ruizarguesonis]TBD01826.1 hypothetical protein ELH25_25435 [Rhizobium ruizarguesonis]TBD17972.1 hypothetical protein ELH24_21715 [Rhizobium ruizarguesonis]TBE99215.1 hypothetical protein ELG98_22830 [Rhizobium ruizarguesonis]